MEIILKNHQMNRIRKENLQVVNNNQIKKEIHSQKDSRNSKIIIMVEHYLIVIRKVKRKKKRKREMSQLIQINSRKVINILKQLEMEKKPRESNSRNNSCIYCNSSLKSSSIESWKGILRKKGKSLFESQGSSYFLDSQNNRRLFRSQLFKEFQKM